MTENPASSISVSPALEISTGKGDQTRKFGFAFPKSLVWKIILPVPLVLILGVVALVSWLPGAIQENTEKAAIAAATTTVDQFKIIRGYYTKNVIKKALASGALTPSFDHKGKEGRIPLPATLIHDLSELLSSGGTRISLFSAFPFPNRKDRKLDDFQKEAWKAINANPDKPFIRKEVVDGKTMIRVGIADKMVAQGCVDCHNSRADTPKNDWKLGDVRGILEVSTAIDDQLAAGALLSNKTAIGVAIFGAVIIALLILVSILFVRKPVGRLAVVMEKMAEGDHGDEIPGVQSRDELGVIARSMQVWKANHVENARLAQERADADEAQRQAERERDSAERQEADRQAAEKERSAELARQRTAEIEEEISKFDSEVGSVLDKVSAAVDEMRASAESMTSTAEETARKSTTVAAAAEQATSNIQMVAAAAEELSASVGEISRQVSESANIARGAVTEASNTNEKIQGLAEAAQKIGDVVSLINDIASQTNLLALNATIEAARAGDAGKGFAVVASEVKSLATQTAKATEEISGQITAIQEATGEAVVAIDGISGVIGQINEISAAIASAVEEQGASSQEIAGNVQQAAAGTQEITNDITQVNRAASETGEVAKKVLDAAEELSRQGEGLRRHIDSFLGSMRAA